MSKVKVGSEPKVEGCSDGCCTQTRQEMANWIQGIIDQAEGGSNGSVQKYVLDNYPTNVHTIEHYFGAAQRRLSRDEQPEAGLFNLVLLGVFIAEKRMGLLRDGHIVPLS